MELRIAAPLRGVLGDDGSIKEVVSTDATIASFEVFAAGCVEKLHYPFIFLESLSCLLSWLNLLIGTLVLLLHATKKARTT